MTSSRGDARKIVSAATAIPEQISLTAFLRTTDMLNMYLQRSLSKEDRSHTRFEVLLALATHEGRMTPTALSKWLFRTKGTVTSMVRSLETHGWVRREANPLDERSTFITLTEEGTQRLVASVPASLETASRVFSCLSPDQLATLDTLHSRLRKRLYELLEDMQGERAATQGKTGE